MRRGSRLTQEPLGLKTVQDADDLLGRVHARLHEIADAARGIQRFLAFAGGFEPDLEKAEQEGSDGENDALESSVYVVSLASHLRKEVSRKQGTRTW